MVLPIQGDGPCNITLSRFYSLLKTLIINKNVIPENTNLKYSLFYKIEIKGGLHYSVVETGDKLEWKIEKAYFKFDNLFSGNKAMGTQFFNNNY